MMSLPLLIFKDDKINNEINSDGFIKLPILNEKEIDILRQLFFKWHPYPITGYYRSFFSQNKTYKNEVKHIISEIVVPKIINHFHDCIFTDGMFVVKPQSHEQLIEIHQDYSFVDETKHWSLNMWLPLVDTDQSNGTLQFLKKSHRFPHTLRGYGTPNIYKEFIPIIEKNLQTIPCKAGEGLFFFHNLIHGSTINKQNEARISISLSIIQKYVPIYFFRKSPNESTVEMYEVYPNFFMDFFEDTNFFPPDAKFLKKLDFKFEKLSEMEFLEKIRN